MDTIHSTFQDNLAAYSVGALDPEEALALERHLRTCAECRADLEGYRRVGTGLLSALPESAPRSKVRQNLQKRLSGEQPRVRSAPSWSFGRFAIAGALVALIALNLLTVSQVNSMKQQQTELLEKHTFDQTAIAMLAYPTTQTITFDENGVSGSLLLDKHRNLAAVFAWNLAVPPSGETYQMWLIDPQGDRTSGGFIKPEPGYAFVTAMIRSSQPLSGFTGFGITLEPEGGSPKPTGPRVFHVDF